PILVRRIATVTISAPEVSIAERVSAKSLYFPVPTRRRERYGLPATISLSSDMSASAYCDDDLELVAVAHHRRAVRAARDDLAVTLHGNLLAGKLERGEERGDVERSFECACATVYGNLDHGQIVARKLPGSKRGISLLAAALLACAGSVFAQNPPGLCPQQRSTVKAPDDFYTRENPQRSSPERIAVGRRLYEKGANPACEACHGLKGDGRGTLA